LAHTQLLIPHALTGTMDIDDLMKEVRHDALFCKSLAANMKLGRCDFLFEE